MPGTGFRKSTLILTVCAVMGLWSALTTICVAQQQGNPLQNINWLRGPAVANMENMAEVKLPPGYLFAAGADTRKIMEMTKNIASGREVGLVAPEGGEWFAVFEFDNVGYVKDDEKTSLDANAMLKAIQEGNEAANKERQRRGWPVMTILGWEQPPKYNEQTHNLEWAIKGESEGHPVVNFNTRILGRKGVMRITLVSDPKVLKGILPAYRNIMTSFDFKTGNRYAEFVQGDKVAQYGLTALVVGGAGVAAAKAGVFKWLWKVLVAVGIAIVALLKKLFGSKGTAAPQ